MPRTGVPAITEKAAAGILTLHSLAESCLNSFPDVPITISSSTGVTEANDCIDSCYTCSEAWQPTEGNTYDLSSSVTDFAGNASTISVQSMEITIPSCSSQESRTTTTKDGGGCFITAISSLPLCFTH